MAVLGMMEINTYMGGVTLRSSSGRCLRVGRRIDGGGCTARQISVNISLALILVLFQWCLTYLIEMVLVMLSKCNSILS